LYKHAVSEGTKPNPQQVVCLQPAVVSPMNCSSLKLYFNFIFTQEATWPAWRCPVIAACRYVMLLSAYALFSLSPLLPSSLSSATDHILLLVITATVHNTSLFNADHMSLRLNCYNGYNNAVWKKKEGSSWGNVCSKRQALKELLNLELHKMTKRKIWLPL